MKRANPYAARCFGGPMDGHVEKIPLGEPVYAFFSPSGKREYYYPAMTQAGGVVLVHSATWKRMEDRDDRP